MTDTTTPARTGAARRAIRYEVATIAYNIGEGAVAIAAGLIAGSVALTGFGFDSIIEVAAATVVLVRLRAELTGGEIDERKQRRALRFIAVTFFALAAYVIAEGARDLLTDSRPDTSWVGIALTGASIVVMPALARAKRRTGQDLGSALVIADAAETRLCAWLSLSTFAGLVAFAATDATWVDPIAGFAIAYFAIREGREAWQGELLCEDHNDDAPEAGTKIA
ncbi:MAG: cation diffusion facilitator family transporter [Acidimicrobiales bacterium]